MTTWHRALTALAVFLCCIELYSASVHAPFVFDDFVLPFIPVGASHREPNLLVWLSGVRPVLMFSYWLNYSWSGLTPFPYHFWNLLLHTANCLLVFLIVEKLLAFTRLDGLKRVLLAFFAMLAFLVHPLQTEVVSYIAGRSEGLGAFFLLCAWCLFLYRPREEISWTTSFAVLALFALAVGSKENMVVLPAVLLLSDFYWNNTSWRHTIRANWRLYLPVGLGIVAAAGRFFSILRMSKSAGFHLKELTPWTYFLTETRAILSYVRLFVLPAGQALDHEFPVSHSIVEHGAIFSLLILATLTVLAIAYRKRYPLASFGFLLFLVLLSPTSSFVPIADPLVERRMYLPMIGLLLIAIEALGRAERFRLFLIAGMCAVLIAAAVATHRRNILWSDPWLLWRDSVVHAPSKARGYGHLATFAVIEGHCRDTVPYLEMGDRYLKDDPHLLMGWAEDLECLGQRDRALSKLQRATVVSPKSYPYELLGLLYGEMGQMSEAKAALDKAVSLGPKSESAYMSRGYWYEVMKDYDRAKSDYSKALEMNPTNFSARARLSRIGNESDPQGTNSRK